MCFFPSQCVKMVKLSCVYLLLLSVACDSYQRSPCPSIFQYKYDKTKWIGVIRIPPSDFGASIKLLLTMALEAELPNPVILKLKNKIFNNYLYIRYTK